ncbi:hypothetical protein [Demequina salsinemoris]|uniref:hypothetical protein n=1 Tax=Demequina salsinemoris TaxID=577470 RepID=UPI000A8E1C32|nr:hypothetical protein [Demequina salsinemoris]
MIEEADCAEKLLGIALVIPTAQGPSAVPARPDEARDSAESIERRSRHNREFGKTLGDLLAEGETLRGGGADVKALKGSGLVLDRAFVCGPWSEPDGVKRIVALLRPAEEASSSNQVHRAIQVALQPTVARQIMHAVGHVGGEQFDENGFLHGANSFSKATFAVAGVLGGGGGEDPAVDDHRRFVKTSVPDINGLERRSRLAVLALLQAETINDIHLGIVDLEPSGAAPLQEASTNLLGSRQANFRRSRWFRTVEGSRVDTLFLRSLQDGLNLPALADEVQSEIEAMARWVAQVAQKAEDERAAARTRWFEGAIGILAIPSVVVGFVQIALPEPGPTALCWGIGLSLGLLAIFGAYIWLRDLKR